MCLLSFVSLNSLSIISVMAKTDLCVNPTAQKDVALYKNLSLIVQIANN
ncbi:hypothetical protein BFV94_1446 [Alteromonas macleodii]|uniref:Uncharacterized protein n=1 Tax=Alteromonas macleodii TaxID=28108 RepID=A0AB36FXE3_ALTMA|nr:hypothetical protein BFV95_1446 [Alteromonas macleodii]OES34669.1 hypothetical protein BFV94_1446 [Alteromonas macleodii]OES36032.1 hypothetical protein BFV93_1442 [Alteromonas macleodii]OES42543.1 hypothetical protein BFV96_1446 [Alteromonas macleodii]